jgi:hypothetical protein
MPVTNPTPTSNPTSRWQRIRRDHPDVHAALQLVAEAVYEQTKEPVDPGAAEADLRAAAEVGFLENGSQGTSFVDPDVRREYLIRHVATITLPVWEEPAGFAEAIADAQRRTSRYAGRREVTTAVLLILAREHGKDIVGRVGELARSTARGRGQNRLFWNLYNPFCEALPELEVEARRLAETLEAVSEATANDGTAGLVYNAVERLAARSGAEGDALYEAFTSRPDLRLMTFVPPVLVGLARSTLEEAHRRALDLSGAADSAVRRAGITALGLFDYSGDDQGRLLETTWERLERGRSEPDPEVDYTLARAYGNLLDQKPEAAEALVDLSVRPDPAVQGQVAWLLFQKSDEAYDEPWFREALLNLAGAPTSHKGVWENLDHSLYRVAREDPNLAVEFMEAMVVGRDYGAEGEEGELPKMLHGAFAELVQHYPGAIEEAVTRWFASSERRLHRAARDVVHATYDITGEKQPWLRLSKPALDELDERTVVYALQRIMGHVLTSRPLAALLLSATRRESCSREFLGFVAGAVSGYVLYNYPHEAGDYLRKRLEAEDVSEPEAEVARAALGQSDAYLATLDSLPLLKEFQPPTQRLYLLRLAEHRQQTQIMDRAKQSSVLLNIMPELPLKYGRSHFMERDDGFTESSELSPFSVSAEKARGEALDPVGQMFQRLGWQSVGLREDEDAETGEHGERAGA